MTLLPVRYFTESEAFLVGRQTRGVEVLPALSLDKPRMLEHPAMGRAALQRKMIRLKDQWHRAEKPWALGCTFCAFSSLELPVLYSAISFPCFYAKQQLGVPRFPTLLEIIDGPKSWLCCLLAVCPWVSDLTFLNISVLISKTAG